MGVKLTNIMQLFGNMRTRSIIIVTGALIFLVVIVGIIGLSRSNQPSEAAANVNVKTVRQIESTPGLQQVTPEYAKVQQQLNQQNYEKAVKNKTSAIPTLIGVNENEAGGANSANGVGGANGQGGFGANGQGGAGANGQGGFGANGQGGPGANGPGGINGQGGVNGQGGINGQASTNGGINGQGGFGANNNNQGANTGANGGASGQGMSLQEQQLRAQLAALQQQQAIAANPALQQQAQKIQQSMQKQAQQLVSSWSAKGGTSTQVYVASPVNMTKTPAEVAQQQAADAAKQQEAPIIKAGDIVFAVLTTGVNSDEPSPVMATILSGPLKGGKLVGSIQKTADLPGTNGPTKVILNFNVMSIPSAPASVPVNAVAIDPDTARTALASDVDHHYLSRYGSVFAAAFLQGYGNAIQSSGSQVLIGPLGNTTVTTGDLTGVQEVAAGFGQVGQEWGNQLQDALDRQNTITVNAGISIGILFLSDVRLNESNYATPAMSQSQVATLAVNAPNAANNNNTVNPRAEVTNNGNNVGNLAPAPATPFQSTNPQSINNNAITPNNTVQTRQLAPGVTQQWGPVYPIYTQQNQ